MLCLFCVGLSVFWKNVSRKQISLPLHLGQLCNVRILHVFSKTYCKQKNVWGFFLHMCRKVTTSLLEAGLDKNYAPVLVHWDSQALRRPYVEIKLSP